MREEAKPARRDVDESMEGGCSGRVREGRYGNRHAPWPAWTTTPNAGLGVPHILSCFWWLPSLHAGTAPLPSLLPSILARVLLSIIHSYMHSHCWQRPRGGHSLILQSLACFSSSARHDVSLVSALAHHDADVRERARPQQELLS